MVDLDTTWPLGPPIMYLDVDDTILQWTNEAPGAAPPYMGRFLSWAFRHFDVRWLTSWCPCGTMEDSRVHNLYNILSGQWSSLREETLKGANHIDGWERLKTDVIDFSMPLNSWIWVEDALLPEEYEILRKHDALVNWVELNVTERPNSVIPVWKSISKRYRIGMDA